MNINKKKVHDFWNKLSCGEELYLSDESKTGYQNQSNSRYKLEGDLIFPFAEFNKYKDKKVLEIGVGLGSDHQKFSESGADLFGIDLTEKAINHTSKRLSLYNLKSNLSVGDAECLKFKEEVFDLVYSWGVLHHSPDTPKAISEVYRVLKKGGVAKIMIYHKWSVVGYMLWVRYALLKLKPFQTLEEIYSNFLESEGTKAYSKNQAKELFSNFSSIEIKTPLTHGDLLESDVGQRHKGLFLRIAKNVFPRWLVRLVMPNSGLFMLIKLKK
jgi:ubiquinone/menaquinone biosynthesis C-methylase UbiE